MILRSTDLLPTSHRPGAGGVRAVAFLALLALAGAGCTVVGGPAAGGVSPAAPPIPSLAEGSLSRQQAESAARLLRQAEQSLLAGDPAAAVSAAQEVVRAYPRAPGSAAALGILARAHLALGQGREGAEAAREYARVLGPTHPLHPGALILGARGLLQAGEGAAAIPFLLALPPSAADSSLSAATDLLREAAGSTSLADLRQLAEEAPASAPLRGVLAVELATALYLRGEDAEAERWARTALEGPLQARERERARSILDGRLEEVLGQAAMLGAILSRSEASPGQLQQAEWIHEGIQVAMEEFKGRLRRPVRVEVMDDHGRPVGGRSAVEALEESGALGAVGPLTREVLVEAVAARRGALPLISPFATVPDWEGAGVLSLSDADVAGARLLARHARNLGLTRVAVVRPGTREAGLEARAFQEELQRLGGSVPREIVFDSAATFFQKELREASALRPDGLFLPLRPGDVQLVAPQVTFFGLDAMGIQLLGTSGWTSDPVLQGVDPRHTNGVIAAIAEGTREESESYRRFRLAYEAYFHKTLRSRVPALGYDAAALLLAALERAPRNGEELWEALLGTRDFPGATGRLSVEDGRILREPALVRIQDRALVPIPSRNR